jgi:transcriptional regulator with XRE-family HTH domain
VLTFGEYIKNLRVEKRITLREFCRRINIDPSNWSKIERGVLQPPKSQIVLQEIAQTLGLTQKSEEWFTLMDLAAISFIPKQLVSDEDILEKLPAFFRTLRGQPPSREELEKLIHLLKEG